MASELERPLPHQLPLCCTSPDLSLVPDQYHDLIEVFSKSCMLSLPSPRPYDCSIDLLMGTPFPTSSLYSLSCPEREAKEKYIRESLAASLIRPSSSPLCFLIFFRTNQRPSHFFFQALINNVLWDFLNRFVFVYLDNILIFSPSLETHLVHV